MMIEYLVLISCIGFLASMVPGPHRKYAAIIGWVFIVSSSFSIYRNISRKAISCTRLWPRFQFPSSSSLFDTCSMRTIQ